MSPVRPFRCFDSRAIVAALGVAAWLIASAWLSRTLAADSTAALLVTAITGWAFLERAGLPHIDWSLCAAPAFTLAWVIGVLLIARRYA